MYASLVAAIIATALGADPSPGGALRAIHLAQSDSATAPSPTPATPPAPTAPPAQASPPTQDNVAVPSITILGSKQAEGVLGKEVRSTANENMGRIVDVVVDRAGRVRAAVIDFGGFLGVGSRRIAVDWNALNFDRGEDKKDTITLELTREQVKAAPEFKDKQAVIVLGAAGSLRPMPYE